MSSPDAERRALAATVAGRAGLLGSPSVASSLERLVADDDPWVRLSVAAVLAPHDDAALGTWLSALNGDADSSRLALAAAARSPAPCFVPHLVELAAHPAAPEQLVEALVAHAEGLVPTLTESGLPPLTRRRVVFALGEAGTDGCRAALVAHLNDGEPEVAEAAARALAVSGHRETSAAPQLRDALASQAVRAHRSLQIIALLPDTAGSEPLHGALRDEMATAGRRIEVLLGLAHEPRVIGAGMAGLGSNTERDRNTAVEMLEVTVGRPLARMLLGISSPALDDGTRIQLVGEYAAPDQEPPRDWLRVLVLDETATGASRGFAPARLYAAPTVHPQEARDLALRFTDDPILSSRRRRNGSLPCRREGDVEPDGRTRRPPRTRARATHLSRTGRPFGRLARRLVVALTRLHCGHRGRLLSRHRCGTLVVPQERGLPCLPWLSLRHRGTARGSTP